MSVKQKRLKVVGFKKNKEDDSEVNNVIAMEERAQYKQRVKFAAAVILTFVAVATIFIVIDSVRMIVSG